VEYLRQPVVLALELVFLVVVTSHALLGVRSMVLDLNPHPAMWRVLNVSLFFLGLITIAYGMQLVWQILE
jgi:succinate dehydrogenase hydrophobic anchor subunit